MVETYRKLLLTSFVVFIDVEHGSNKILRLAIATFVTGARHPFNPPSTLSTIGSGPRVLRAPPSGAYAVVLARVRPNRDVMSNDYAVAAQLVLLCCFVCGIVIKLCEDDYLEQDAEEGESRRRGRDSHPAHDSLVVVAALVLKQMPPPRTAATPSWACRRRGRRR